MINVKDIKQFHGPLYSNGPWNSKTESCCLLCKTKNSTSPKLKHWAKGLCRSCYRRLSVNHRLYNDKWNDIHSKSVKFRDSARKKEYKYVEPHQFEFSRGDIETVLERYDWKCAYSKMPLQGYDHKLPNAFQIEYCIDSEGNMTLVPVARSINCSKKNLSSKEKLRRWAKERGITYPFTYIPPESN